MHLGRILISRDRIASRVAAMGEEISRELAESVAGTPGPVVLVPILTGAIVLVSDLIRNIPLAMSIKPITVTSYPGTAMTSQGANIRGGIPVDLKGAHVLVVDDILDSGRTLGLIRRIIAAQEPASLRIAVLLRKRKPTGREEEVEVEYAGFEIEDEFVVGYGLDYDGYYRNMPDIGVLEPD